MGSPDSPPLRPEEAGPFVSSSQIFPWVVNTLIVHDDGIYRIKMQSKGYEKKFDLYPFIFGYSASAQ